MSNPETIGKAARFIALDSSIKKFWLKTEKKSIDGHSLSFFQTVIKNNCYLRGSFILSAVLSFVSVTSSARADSTSWTGEEGDWFSETKWDNGVPDYSKDAFINNGGKPSISTPGALARSVTLGLNAGDSGTLGISGSTAQLDVPIDCDGGIPGAIKIGYRDRGTLIITAGAHVNCGNAYIAALQGGEFLTSNGAVTVDGTDSTWTISGACESRLFIGGTHNASGDDPGGVALLSITGGASVVVNNSAGAQTAVVVGISGTLTGNGTLDTADSAWPITLVNGTLAPTDTLTIWGDLRLTETSTMTCSVTPQAHDEAQVSGTATLYQSSRLSVTMSGTFTPDTQFTLLHAESGVFGVFTNVSIKYPVGQHFRPVITYDANNVNVYLQPR